MPKIEPNNGLSQLVVLGAGGGLPGPTATITSLINSNNTNNNNPSAGSGGGGLGVAIPGSSGGVGGGNNNSTTSSSSLINAGMMGNNNGTGPGGLVIGRGPGGAVEQQQGGPDLGPDMPQKKFPCHLCRRSFMHKQSLDIHMRSHTGKKLFLTCNLVF